ncbi:NfeD family protein [Catellatospora sichuanensis]|uniref:NfeD family protein n=1 Tax=Catellatospora sichuanensis TaxID=1969805 RepID=UPI0011829BCA|nr:NfeD family protein [Catellatospora sichuanensis]
MKSIGSLLLVLATSLLAMLIPAVGAPAAADEQVLAVRVDGPITPVAAGYVTDAVRQGEDRGVQALVLELDTPGGLDTSMRDIVQALLAAKVPVVVYVTPPGARAASAGALITFAAHVAAMAPATTIGAATPVDAQTGEKAGDKVINDAAAYAESVAAQRGRDTAFAIDTVRQGRAVSAAEALRVGAIDLIAPDREALLKALDGRTVTLADADTVTLRTADATVTEYEPGWARRLLGVLADPTLAFLFLSLGTLAVMYELAAPGHGFSGAIGVILLILGFFALSVLPVSVAGLALLALAAGLFAAELFAPGIGVFAAGGAIALLLAGVFLFEGTMRVNPAVLLPTAAVVAVGTVIAGRLAWRARRNPPVSGAATLIGAVAPVASGTGGQADLHVDGAWWTAESADGSPLRPGRLVRVVGMDGLRLIVEPADDSAHPGPADGGQNRHV